MRFKLDHIGLVVENIESFIKLLQIMGFNEGTEPLPDPIQKVNASFVNVGDGEDVYIELLEPTHPSSPITNFSTKRGEGLHHLCFKVDDIEKASKELVEKGFPMVSPAMDCEAYDKNLKRDCKGSTRIAFFLISKHILIELIEKGR